MNDDDAKLVDAAHRKWDVDADAVLGDGGAMALLERRYPEDMSMHAAVRVLAVEVERLKRRVAELEEKD